MARPAFTPAAAPTALAAALFFSAVTRGDVAVVADVLASCPNAARWVKPVKPNDQPFAKNETGLMLAAAEGQVEVMRLLAAAGADLDARQSRGWTALMYAAERSRDGAVEFLLSKGANTGLKNEGGDTAAGIAAQRQDFALARKINDALALYGLAFFQNGQKPLPAPATARWKKRP